MGMLDWEKRQELLALLQSTKKDIDAGILLSPKARTRPGIGLVTSYDRAWQRMFLAVPFGVILGSCIALLALGVSALDNLGLLGSIKGPIAALYTAPVVPWSLVRMGVGLALLFFVTFIMGKFSFGMGPLDMDLNGIYHSAPQGRCYTPWTKVVTGRTVRKKGIKLLLEDGGILTFRVPQDERNDLAEVIEHLIVRNQPGDLMGKLQDYSPQVDVLQSHPGGTEAPNTST